MAQPLQVGDVVQVNAGTKIRIGVVLGIRPMPAPQRPHVRVAWVTGTDRTADIDKANLPVSPKTRLAAGLPIDRPSFFYSTNTGWFEDGGALVSPHPRGGRATPLLRTELDAMVVRGAALHAPP